MALSRKQRGMLHQARRDIGLEDEEYRQILWERAGVETASNLNQRGFEAVMEAFQELGFRPSHGAAFLGDRPGMATARQVSYIRRLWEEFAGRRADDAFDHWLDRWFGVSSLRFIDRETASKVIAALKDMASRS